MNKDKQNIEIGIFQLLDNYNKNPNVENSQLIVNNLLSIPLNLYATSNGLSVYSYATLLSLDVLKIIHKVYRKQRHHLYGEPYEILNENKSKPIHIAVEHNLKPQLEYLITNVKVNVNAVDGKGNNILHLACIYERPELLRLILYLSNIQIDAFNNKLETPLRICIDKDNDELASILLKRGAHILYRSYKYMVNLYDYAKKLKRDKIVLLFKKFLKSKKNKSKLENMKAYYLRKRKEYTKEYVFLCESLDSDNNLDSVKLFANKLNIVYSKDINKRDLCQKIAQQITLYDIKRRLK